MASGRGWQEAGQSLGGLAALIAKLREADAEKARQGVEDTRRHGQEDLNLAQDKAQTDAYLLEHGGGRGVLPGMTPTLDFGAGRVTPSPLAMQPPAPTDRGDGSDTGPAAPPPIFSGSGVGLGARPVAPQLNLPPMPTSADAGSPAPAPAPSGVFSKANATPDARFSAIGPEGFGYVENPDARAIRLDREKEARHEGDLTTQGHGMAAWLRQARPDLTPDGAEGRGQLLVRGVTAGEMTDRLPPADRGLPTFDQAYDIVREKYQTTEQDSSGRPIVTGYKVPVADMIAEAQAMARGQRYSPPPPAVPKPSPGAMAGYPAPDVAAVMGGGNLPAAPAPGGVTSAETSQLRDWARIHGRDKVAASLLKNGKTQAEVDSILGPAR